jgi:hypothetical protein
MRRVARRSHVHLGTYRRSTVGGRLLAWLAVVTLAVSLAAVGVVYIAVQYQNIPAPPPGREAGATDHRSG